MAEKEMREKEQKKKEINAIINTVEELSDEDLDKVVGGVKKTCPAGQVLVGNLCKKK